MSTQNRPLLVGLVSPGLFWLAASVAQGQGTPRPQGLPSIPAPASSATYSVLLMSNGTVVQGEILDDPAGGVYRLKTRGGQVPYPKSSVKRAGQSIDELYRYQVAALPPGDGDERMKLVRWCLTEHLPDLAREQLAEVLKLCPDDNQAKRMAANLDANAENRDRDMAVRQTSGELSADDAPAPLPPGLGKTLRRGFGNTLPEIFDLPPAVAVRRAAEFAQYVQPILQQNCANCHNEKYQGDFQLVLVKGRRDQQNPEIARANLDAVLRLVNPDDPARSELLSAGLVPHGPNKSKGAIFRGPNDPQYHVLSTWVRRVRPANANPNPAAGGKATGFGGEGVTQAGYVPAEATDGFASDKPGRNGATFSTGMAVDKTPAYPTPGATRVVNEYNESADFSRGAAGDFPLPFAAGGNEMRQPTPPRRAGLGTSPPPLPKTKPATGRGAPRKVEDAPADPPGIAPTTATLIAPGTVAVEVGGHPNDLPGMNQPKYPTMPKPATEAEADPDDEGRPKPAPKAAPAKKKPRVDPALLEQLIKARNAGAP